MELYDIVLQLEEQKRRKKAEIEKEGQEFFETPMGKWMIEQVQKSQEKQKNN